ncbi:MAG: hypothetical protein ACE5JL_14680, partial [Dehalococcoidia bacterium]
MIRPRRWKHSIAIPVALAMLAIATALGAACGSDGTEPAGPLETPTSEAGGPGVQMTPTPSPAQEAPDSSSPELSDAPDVTQPETPTPPSATEPGQLDLLLTLLQGGTTSGNLGLAFSAVSEIQASGDRTFVPALIDYLRVPVSRQQVQFNAQVVVPALEAMTGESFGYDLKAWGEWLGRQPDITLFEGFARWKAVLYSMLDP